MSSNNPPKDFNSSHKILIREKWNHPLIKYLTKKLGDQLVYMGLPSSKADDIKTWIDQIKIVIAFQCRVYGEIADENQSRDEIERLEEILRAFERQNKLDYFVVYDGYIEEIVLRGNDNSPHRIDFEQNSVVTLYNLDFCNKISSPNEYVDSRGNVQVAYKFNAINKLLTLQDSISTVSDRFLFLLTVHCSYEGSELHDFIQNPPDSTLKGYLEKYKKIKSKEERSARIVRLFVVHLIYRDFLAHNFSPHVLPIIKYNGLNNTPLLHFVVFGIKSNNTASGAPVHQNIEEVLDDKFISFETDQIVNLASDIDEKDVKVLNVVEYFTNSRTYSKLWK